MEKTLTQQISATVVQFCLECTWMDGLFNRTRCEHLDAIDETGIPTPWTDDLHGGFVCRAFRRKD